MTPTPEQKRLISTATALLEQASEAAIAGDQARFDKLVQAAAACIALAGPRAVLDTRDPTAAGRQKRCRAMKRRMARRKPVKRRMVRRKPGGTA